MSYKIYEEILEKEFESYKEENIIKQKEYETFTKLEEEVIKNPYTNYYFKISNEF